MDESGSSGIDRLHTAGQSLMLAADSIRKGGSGSAGQSVVASIQFSQVLLESFLIDPTIFSPDKEDFADILREVRASLEVSKQAVNEVLGASQSSQSSQSSSQSSTDPDSSRSGDHLATLQRQVSADKGLDSVAGLQLAKQLLREAVVLPMRYRHLFTGARKPWKSVLLYGPPGTGKTRLAHAVAAEVGAELYVVSPADLLSSWFGKTEQNIRDLFGQLRARALTHSVIVFIDEVDGICRRRTDQEAESTRRMKTELLTQLQEAAAGVDPGPVQGQLFFLCATNCPWEIDPAFLRRFQRRIYIPLPDRDSRLEIIRALAVGSDIGLRDSEWQGLLDQTEGFSGSDLVDLVRNALYQPVREMDTATHWKPVEGGWTPCASNMVGALPHNVFSFPPHKVFPRNVTIEDFKKVGREAQPTVRREDLARYEQFTDQFGRFG